MIFRKVPKLNYRPPSREYTDEEARLIAFSTLQIYLGREKENQARSEFCRLERDGYHGRFLMQKCMHQGALLSRNNILEDEMKNNPPKHSWIETIKRLKTCSAKDKKRYEMAILYFCEQLPPETIAGMKNKHMDFCYQDAREQLYDASRNL